MFVNLSAVMLRLCEPFLDANLTKRDKIDPKYVFNSSRLDLRFVSFFKHTHIGVLFINLLHFYKGSIMFTILSFSEN